MSTDFGVQAAVLQQSLHKKAPARPEPSARPERRADPRSSTPRMQGPVSRGSKAMLRARNALAKDAKALERLRRLIASEQFRALSPSIRYHLLGRTLSVPIRDEGYLDDVFRSLGSILKWPQASIPHFVDQLARHADCGDARTCLVKFARLEVTSSLAPMTRADLITYLSGPSYGEMASNEDSLRTWWNRRRQDLLNMLMSLDATSSPSLEDDVAGFIGLPSRHLTLVDSETMGASRAGVILGDPLKATEYAYYAAAMKDRSQRIQLRLHATQPLDRRVILNRTFQGLETRLSRREEFGLVSWIQENHWVGIDWLPCDGRGLPPGVRLNMHQLFGAVKNMASTLAAPREVLRFKYVRLRQGRRLKPAGRQNSGMMALMNELAAA